MMQYWCIEGLISIKSMQNHILWNSFIQSNVTDMSDDLNQKTEFCYGGAGDTFKAQTIMTIFSDINLTFSKMLSWGKIGSSNNRKLFLKCNGEIPNR